MKNEYFLFLDESKPNTNTDTFCLGGFIIEKNEYENTLIPAVNRIKKEVFNTEDIIFHLYDIKKAVVPFNIFKDSTIRNKFWIDIKKVINDSNIKVLGVCIDCKQYRTMYADGNLNDEYAITMQIIIENFVHFLIKNNGRGVIYAESRQENENYTLLNHYYEVLTKGTLYFNRTALQKYLTIIQFPPKSENNVGLQIADFIPGSLSRLSTGRRDDYNLGALFSTKLYDGGINMNERYGFKCLL